ncbi:MAG: hypothetical protein QOI38_1086 [Sphingomonadales bacterium]|jgi:ElaB/YqjD/DUF883 family membrane-anchored ribosome-binding protein|nr:hypothetical protein [Sphingomonadales bacterium]
MTDTRTETTGTGTTSGGTSSGATSGGDRQRSRAGEAYDATRARTSAAFAGVRERAAGAGRWTGEEISSNPMTAVAGGFALGALVAAILPRTERETELLGGVGSKITDAAREATKSAVDAGRQQVEEISESAATRVGEAVIGAVASATGASEKG